MKNKNQGMQKSGMSGQTNRALNDLEKEAREEISMNDYNEEYRKATDQENEVHNDRQLLSSQDSSSHTGTHGKTASSYSLQNGGRKNARGAKPDSLKKGSIEERNAGITDPGRGSRSTGSTRQGTVLKNDPVKTAGRKMTGSRGAPGLVNKIQETNVRVEKKDNRS